MEARAEIRRRALAALAVEKFTSDSRKIVEFGHFLLERGIESENIYILAGTQKDSNCEKMQYFGRVMEELGIEIPEDAEFDSLYVKSVAEEVVSGEADPSVAIRQLEKMYTRPNPSQFFFEFLEISDGLDLFDEGRLASGMTRENHNAYIKHTFELYLAFLSIEVPGDFYRQGYCSSCGKRSLPIQKKKRIGLFGPVHTFQTCKFCGGVEFSFTRYNAGKDLYLEETGSKPI